MMPSALYVGLGLIVGLLLGWAWRSRRSSPADRRVEEELRQQILAREAELGAARERMTQLAAGHSAVAAELAAERVRMQEQKLARERLEQERAAQQEQMVAGRTREAEMGERIAFLNERIAAERKQLEALQQQFSREFEAISNKLLVDSSARFNQQSAESLDRLLGPLRDNLAQFKASLDTNRLEAASHSALLKDQVGRIGTEAANLARALKGDAKVLGNWGEAMLDQLLEKSGLQRDVHYRRQQSATGAEGDQRFLDVVIDLPEQRHLIVDSKVSLRSFEEACNASDETVRAELLGRHVDAMRKHLRDLGRKRYHGSAGFLSPDFVLMYIPIEAAYFAVIGREPTLFEEALEEGVVLVSNSTLLPTLRTVAAVWRLADQQKNALEIAERGGRLHDKFAGFVDDMRKVGEALQAGRDAWQAANSKLHAGPGNLVRQAGQLKALGAKAARTLPGAAAEE